MKFKTHEEIKDLYETGKYDIYYDDNKVNYVVTNIGSTILCKSVDRNLGMGAINNFPIENFYAEKKIIVEDKENDNNYRESNEIELQSEPVN